jgi:hypothetical protein
MSYTSRNFDFLTIIVLEEEYNLWSSLFTVVFDCVSLPAVSPDSLLSILFTAHLSIY